MRFRILPIFLIAIGVLLGNLGVIPAVKMREFFRVWWSAFLIAFGAAMLLRPHGACRERFEHRHRGDRAAEPDRGNPVAGGAPQP